jgi:hypothetical protein
MTVVVEHRPLIPCHLPQRHALLLRLFYGWIEILRRVQRESLGDCRGTYAFVLDFRIQGLELLR